MRRRLNIITAILVILAILLASCSPSAANGDGTGTAGEERTRSETKEPVKGDTNGDILTAAEKPCGGKAFSIDLAEDEIMLDILPEGDGYRLLTGTPHDFGEEHPGLRSGPKRSERQRIWPCLTAGTAYWTLVSNRRGKANRPRKR